MSNSEINVFDLDGTLYKLEGGSYSDSPLSDEINQRARRNVKAWVEDTEISEEKFWKVVSNEYGEDISYAARDLLGVDRETYFNRVWDIPNPERFIEGSFTSVFSRIQNEINIVVTSSPEIWADRVVDYLEIEDKIDLLSSGEIGPQKPSREAFQRPIESVTDSKVEKAWFLGDQPDDFPESKPANVESSSTVYVGSGPPPERADYVLESIQELPEVKRDERSSY